MTNVLVDLGNYNIKYLAERRGFFSAKYSTKFNPNPEMFQRINFNGETTYIEIGEYEREFNKVNKNYLPLLFYAISNATEESDINLCLLLPIAQMPNKDKFINKLKNNSFNFLINGVPKTININKVAVLPEGLVSFYSMQSKDEDTLIIDVGSRTVNYASFVEGKIESNFTEKIGVLDLYSSIKDIENAKGNDLIEEQIERLIKNKRIIVEPKVYLDFLKDILNRTKAKVNIKDYKVVFVGGGAILLKPYIEANTPAIIHEDSVYANLIGARTLCETMWKRGKYMNKSMRIYITLNYKKEKDKIILDYLNTTYSHSETIKNILFQIASKGINKMNIGADFSQIKKSIKEQKGEDNINKVIDEPITNKITIESMEDIDDDIKNMFM